MCLINRWVDNRLGALTQCLSGIFFIWGVSATCRRFNLVSIIFRMRSRARLAHINNIDILDKSVRAQCVMSWLIMALGQRWILSYPWKWGFTPPCDILSAQFDPPASMQQLLVHAVGVGGAVYPPPKVWSSSCHSVTYTISLLSWGIQMWCQLSLEQPIPILSAGQRQNVRRTLLLQSHNFWYDRIVIVTVAK